MASKASQKEGEDNSYRDSQYMARVLGVISAFIVLALAGVIFSKDIATGVKLVSVGITGLGIGFVVGFMAAQKWGWTSQKS